jgi:hypothetical protein
MLLNMPRVTFCSSSWALLNCRCSLRFTYKSRGRQTDHDWKHIHLGFYTETGGCDCSLKVLLMMGKMLPRACWAAFTRLNNKRFYNWVCIWLVVLFEFFNIIRGLKSRVFILTPLWILLLSALVQPLKNPMASPHLAVPSKCLTFHIENCALLGCYAATSTALSYFGAEAWNYAQYSVLVFIPFEIINFE